MSTEWYRDGLRFRCSGCGHCCTGAPGYVWVRLTEVERLAAHLGLSIDAFGKRYLRRVGRRLSLVERPNGDCVFFDRGCQVYSARPEQCRSYPFWPEHIASREAWEAEAGECPGIGEGRLYSVEEIESIRDGRRDASDGLPGA